MKIAEVLKENLEEGITRITFADGQQKFLRTYGKMGNDEIIAYFEKLGKKIKCIDDDCDIKEFWPAVGHALLRQAGNSLASAASIAYAPGTNKDQAKKEKEERKNKVKDDEIKVDGS